MIELEWLNGEEGAFWRQSPRRRAQLVALWTEKHAPPPAANLPGPVTQVSGDEFMARMRKHYGGK